MYVFRRRPCRDILGRHAVAVGRQLRCGSTDLQAALRPFYFAVHPDFFGDHPRERSINENSLKLLSEYLQKCEGKQAIPKTTVPFYVRQVDRRGSSSEGSFRLGLRLITVLLDPNDTGGSLARLLEASGVPSHKIQSTLATHKAESSATHSPKQTDRTVPEDGTATAVVPSQDASLAAFRQWIAESVSLARERDKLWRRTANECAELSGSLASQLNLADVRWDCGWRYSYYLTCLRSLAALCKQHAGAASSLTGRRLIFGNDTGVTASGDVMLGCEDVSSTWLQLISNISSYDAAVEWIPQGEIMLSELLGGATIVRKTVQPLPMVLEYSHAVSDLVGRLRMARHATHLSSALRHKALFDVEVMVTGFAGELALTPTGQFNLPASTPLHSAVRFIELKESESRELLHHSRRSMQRATELMARVQDLFRMHSVTKDMVLTWQQVIACCEALLSHSEEIGDSRLKGLRLKLTPYYALTADGEMCLLWQWRGGTSG